MGSDRFNRRRLQRLPGTAALALAVAMSLTVPQEGLAGQLADSGRSPASTLDAGAPFPPAAPARQADELRLTLAEAIRIAFDHNLDISVVDYDRRMARETVFSARGAFDPILQFGAPVGQGGGFGGGNTARSGGLGFVNSTQPTANQLAGANTLANTTFTSSANLGQTLPFGARYDVNYLITRGTSNSGFTSLNPSWNNVLTLSLTQPLLRGRGRAAGSSQLLLAQRNVEVSEEAFRDQVEAILLQVEQEYWEMVFAERNLSVAQQSLRLAQEQLERTHAQVEVGMLAPVQETQAEAAVAQRRSDLISARNAAESAADRLKALLRAEALPQGWGTPVAAVEDPATEPEKVDLEQALALARQRRADLGQSRAQISARRVETDAARSDLLPQVDFTGSLGFSGIGGNLLVRDGFFGPVIDTKGGGFSDAAGQLFNFDFRTWSVGVNITLPFRNRTAKGNYAHATLAEDRARTELRRAEQQAILEVRDAVRQLAAAAEQMEATRVARELAQRQLEIEQDRFEVGMSTNFEVLEFQDDLAQASTAEVRAMVDYRLARAQLDRSTGTLLENAGIGLR